MDGILLKKLKISRRRKKIKIRQFVYILAKQCGSNFNLTNFLTQNSALIFSLFPKKNFSCKTYWPLYCDDFETLWISRFWRWGNSLEEMLESIDCSMFTYRIWKGGEYFSHLNFELHLWNITEYILEVWYQLLLYRRWL